MGSAFDRRSSGRVAGGLTRAPRRGDIFFVDFNPARGSEQAGVRPACVISVDSFNRAMPVVVVAAVTSKLKNSRLVVRLPAGQPLKLESDVLAFQVVSVDKSRLRSYEGSLTADQLREVEQKLRLCWGL